MEIGSFSLLRLASASLESLGPYEVHGILDLSAESTQLTLCSSMCPLQTERLASIRLFPNPELDQEQFKIAQEELIFAESIVVEDERYLPISELDLRVLNSEIASSINRFTESWPEFSLTSVSLFGINSAHPALVDLLQVGLGVPVESRCPSLLSSISSLHFDKKLLVIRGISRLIGLGCGLLSKVINDSEDTQSVVVRKQPSYQLSIFAQDSDVVISSIEDIEEEVSSLSGDNMSANFGLSVAGDNVEAELPSLSVERVVKVEVKELKESENVSEDVPLEEEWPSLSLEGVDEGKELKQSHIQI